MGQEQNTLTQGGSARSDRHRRPRVCLRKGCEQTYQPLRWNQRYCQEPDCLRAVRRWRAAKRQREHRRISKNRQRHASAEAARRQRRRETSETAGQDGDSRPQDAPDRCAWSRSKNNFPDFCDRPGCYQPPRVSHRAPSRYCGDDCRQAIRRVRDRERKWLSRNMVATFTKRGTRRETNVHTKAFVPHNPQASGQDGEPFSVGDYRASNREGLSCHSHQPQENHHDDDPKTRTCLGPRSPPTP